MAGARRRRCGRAASFSGRGTAASTSASPSIRFDEARRAYPGIRVVVHPECRLEVIEAADSYGSTEHIIQAVGGSAPGSRWAVGTEANLVARLARENPDKLVVSLEPEPCACTTMYRVHPAYLCWVLERLVEGEVVNQVTVEPETARWAKLALERMLAVR